MSNVKSELNRAVAGRKRFRDEALRYRNDVAKLRKDAETSIAVIQRQNQEYAQLERQAKAYRVLAERAYLMLGLNNVEQVFTAELARVCLDEFPYSAPPYTLRRDAENQLALTPQQLHARYEGNSNG